MKLILDEWIVREVIDTLYMARTTLLGITGLDSPQDVSKKSANETAITRRISKAIDIIQQSEQPHISESLDEVAEEYRKESYRKSVMPNIDGPMPEYVGSIKDAFIAGAKWQEKKDQETIKLAEEHAFLAGADWQREQMMKDAVKGEITKDNRGNNVVRTGVFNKDFEYGDKVRVIVLPKED